METRAIEMFTDFTLKINHKLSQIDEVKNVNAISNMVTRLADAVLLTNDRIKHGTAVYSVDGIVYITLIIYVSDARVPHEVDKLSIDLEYNTRTKKLTIKTINVFDIYAYLVSLPMHNVSNRVCVRHTTSIMTTIDKLSPTGLLFTGEDDRYHTLHIHTIEASNNVRYECYYVDAIEKYLLRIYKVINDTEKAHTHINGEVLTHELLLKLYKSVEVTHIDLISNNNTLTIKG